MEQRSAVATCADRYYVKVRWTSQRGRQVQIKVREVRIKDRMLGLRFCGHGEIHSAVASPETAK